MQVEDVNSSLGAFRYVPAYIIGHINPAAMKEIGALNQELASQLLGLQQAGRLLNIMFDFRLVILLRTRACCVNWRRFPHNSAFHTAKFWHPCLRHLLIAASMFGPVNSLQTCEEGMACIRVSLCGGVLTGALCHKVCPPTPPPPPHTHAFPMPWCSSIFR